MAGHPSADGDTSTIVQRAPARCKGARAVFRFTGRSVAMVAPTGPGRGKARISVDGKTVAVVDLRGNDHRQRQLVWARAWSTSRRHTLRVEVLGTAGRPRVDLDAFLVLR